MSNQPPQAAIEAAKPLLSEAMDIINAVAEKCPNCSGAGRDHDGEGWLDTSCPDCVWAYNALNRLDRARKAIDITTCALRKENDELKAEVEKLRVDKFQVANENIDLRRDNGQLRTDLAQREEQLSKALEENKAFRSCQDAQEKYDSTLEAKFQSEIDRLRGELEKARTACAAAQEALRSHHEWSDYQSKHNQIVYVGTLRADTERALASDCGQPILDRMKQLEDLVREMERYCTDGPPPFLRSFRDRCRVVLHERKPA